MALIHQADLRPSKLELLAQWLPAQPWYASADATDLQRVAACRFDDPAGAVGIETMIVRNGDGPLVHTPLTYRDAPLAGAEQWLLGTTEHSVLGRRWVYDACADPVYVLALTTAILTGGTEAEEFVQIDGQPRQRDVSMHITGSGKLGVDVPPISAVSPDDADPSVIRTDSVSLTVRRLLGAEAVGEHTATAAWPGQSMPILLASLEL